MHTHSLTRSPVVANPSKCIVGKCHGHRDKNETYAQYPELRIKQGTGINAACCTTLVLIHILLDVGVDMMD